MATADDARFEALAREFCLNLETGRGSLAELYLWIVGLVQAGLRLSDPDVLDDDDGIYGHPDPAGSEPLRLKVAATLRTFPPGDPYWMVFDPIPDDTFSFPGEDAVGLDHLFDDVLDIHQELAEGLAIADRGDLDRAVWEWRFGFLAHWGIHATSALAPLHHLLREQLQPWSRRS